MSEINNNRFLALKVLLFLALMDQVLDEIAGGSCEESHNLGVFLWIISHECGICFTCR